MGMGGAAGAAASSPCRRSCAATARRGNSSPDATATDEASALEPESESESESAGCIRASAISGPRATVAERLENGVVLGRAEGMEEG